MPATPISAFLVGLATGVVFLLSRVLPFATFLERFVVMVLVMLCLAAWVRFVMGPMVWYREWYGFGWMPEDGLAKGVVRGLLWILGVGIVVLSAEAIGHS